MSLKNIVSYVINTRICVLQKHLKLFIIIQWTYFLVAVWGPFLIISPASTLHNWQQEMARFVPMFKVVPYWGNPQERKILRQFWDTKDLHTKEASFHVVITSYQLVITDYKYFNRIKWQYMILDEAQAIKSTSRLVLTQMFIYIL